MYFRLLHDDTTGAVSYLLADLDTGDAVLVDPRGADVPLLRAMLDEKQLRLRWLLRTHEHDDQHHHDHMRDEHEETDPKNDRYALWLQDYL
jgi:glyoxylase-like metal-dependent hydrolase (beta-lactamase superfamily II)